MDFLDESESTETLILTARHLIGGEELRPLNNITNQINLKCMTPECGPSSIKHSGIKSITESIKDARKKLKQDWDKLKNTDILDKNRKLSEKLKKNSDIEEILIGVAVYLEIPNVQRKKTLKTVLKSMGATVYDSFVKEVTHVVYKNGSLETYKRAKLMNVHLVSVLWVESCRTSKRIVSEKLFPVHENDGNIYSPTVFRKFLRDESKNLVYDQSSGLLIRKAASHPRLNLNKLTVRKSSSADSSPRSDTEEAESSTESITLQLSSDESPEDPDNPKTTTNPCVTSRRRLFIKQPIKGSFIKLTQDDKSQLPPKPTKKPKEKQIESIYDIENMRLFPVNFTTLRRSPQKNSGKITSLASTYLHSDENKHLRRVAMKLGRFKFNTTVNSDTTHLVVGELVRTVNLLKAIARGCWILNKQWFLESERVGYWLAEEHFELSQFSPVVRRNRIQKRTFGKFFGFDVFDDCGGIYVDDDCNPPQKDLRELIELCGGELSDKEDAEIVVGRVESDKTCVSEQWILDSITIGRCKATSKYSIVSS